jgi:hypothetical protein
MTTFHIGIIYDGYTRTEGGEDGPVERWVEVFLVGASTQPGRNFVLDAQFATEAEAIEAMKALDHDPSTKPEAWGETEPTYGSEAWGSEDEYNLACFEADAFNEPRPRW